MRSSEAVLGPFVLLRGRIIRTRGFHSLTPYRKAHSHLSALTTPSKPIQSSMSPLTAVLFLSLILAPASMAAPVQPHTVPRTPDSVSPLMPTSTSTSPSDVPPPPVFTFGSYATTFSYDLGLTVLLTGPSGLPHVSSPTAANAPASSTPVLEMDWLS